MEWALVYTQMHNSILFYNILFLIKVTRWTPLNIIYNNSLYEAVVITLVTE